MVEKHTEPCTCNNPEKGFYYKHRGSENGCKCEKFVPHQHCVNCGGIIQVS